VWHAAHAAVYWADINRFMIHRFTLSDRCVRSWLFDEPVAAVAVTDQENMLVAVLGSRVIFWNPTSDARHDQGFRLENWPQVRLNDARPDPRGSLWVGSMRNNVNSDGSAGEAGGTEGILYRIDPEGTVTIFRRDIGIANTVAWSPDRRRFYFGDSLANVVWVYDYDPNSGVISNERPFLKQFSRGVPDGSVIDAEGYLWNCRFDGGCIVRVAPNGSIDRVVEMPAKNVTNCAFGGPSLRTLYITTASLNCPDSDRLAGGLFAVETTVGGVPGNQFRLAGGIATLESDS
jgi:sugar lactone lactonase YvrE